MRIRTIEFGRISDVWICELSDIMLFMIVDPQIYRRIEEKKRELDSLRPLSPAALERLKNEFSIELAYHSNAIEGNTLTLRETKLVIEEGLTIRGKSLREHFEAINHHKAFELLESLLKRKKLTESDILAIHAAVLAGSDESIAGHFRKINVRILGAIKSPPRFEKIPKLMAELVHSVNKNPEKLHPVEMAALTHHRLVEIHPFVDGNGRTARLLMNLLLLRQGYPITMILKVDRKRYYDGLRQADQLNLKPFADFIARNVERSLDLYLDAFMGRDEFISLSRAAKRSPYSQEYLSLLARKGRIEAIKLGRIWHIKRSVLQKYIRQQQKRK